MKIMVSELDYWGSVSKEIEFYCSNINCGVESVKDLNEYWDKFIMGFECDCCGRNFPKSVMIHMSYGHKELDGRYCVVCSHKIYDKMGFCDECDEQYPKSHLYVNSVDKTTLCKGCIGRLHFEEETDD